MDNQLVIIGGMGPQASLKLHQLLLELSADSNERAPDDYPTILHASLSVPDFVANKAAEPRAIEVINQACATLPLESAGAIGMACNTAHMLLKDLSIPHYNFVSMIESVVRHIQDLGVQKVGILASPNTIRSGLYKRALENVGVDTLSPSTADIAVLDMLIHEVIAGHDVRQLRPTLTGIAKKLQDQGADSILLGCTELPLVGVDSELPTVDSLSALAVKMIEHAAHKQAAVTSSVR